MAGKRPQNICIDLSLSTDEEGRQDDCAPRNSYATAGKRRRVGSVTPATATGGSSVAAAEGDTGSAPSLLEQQQQQRIAISRAAAVARRGRKLAAAVKERARQLAAQSSCPVNGCAGKEPRRGWKVADFVSEPVGVYKYTSGRFHALFAGDGVPAVFAGCFADQVTCAQAWDELARMSGWPCLNYPTPSSNEKAIHKHLQSKIAAAVAAPYPHAPTDAAWRDGQLQQLRDRGDYSSVWTSGGGSNGGSGGSYPPPPASADTAMQQDPHDTAPGNQLCRSFQPHIATVRKKGAGQSQPRASAMDTFARPTQRAKCVRSCIEYKGDWAVNLATFDAELRFAKGSWVLNFQPKLAAAIYARYAGPDAIVYDSSSGWGGRMLGAWLAPNVRKYIGVEPSTKTFNGLVELRKLLHGQAQGSPDSDPGPGSGPGAATGASSHARVDKRTATEIDLRMIGSEDVELPPNSVDFAFTSPPYFTLELYCSEATQSHIKFPTFDKWRDIFLKQTLTTTYNALKPGGLMLVNINSNKNFLKHGIDLVHATTEIACSILGAVQLDSLRLLKAQAQINACDGDGEPILVFRKSDVAKRAPAKPHCR